MYVCILNSQQHLQMFFVMTYSVKKPSRWKVFRLFTPKGGGRSTSQCAFHNNSQVFVCSAGFSHNFMQLLITWLHRCFSPCPVLCQSCIPLLPLSHLRKLGRLYSKDQIICFYGTAVYLDLCSYHCQSSTISVVYLHKQHHPVWSYSSSRLLLHNKTDTLSLPSLQKASFWQCLYCSFCCVE